MDAAQFHAQNVATAVNDYAWVVSMYVEEHQPGYEDFDTVATRVFMTLSIGRDGSARNVRSTTSSLWPKLTLTTKPLHAATDRVVLRKVVGRDLTWIYPDPTPYDAVDDAPAPDRVGIVAKEDISFAKPIIVVEHRTHDVRLRLAWDLRVTKHGHEWTFIVDTKTGAVISQAPFFPGE
jgi:hypothetical protein